MKSFKRRKIQDKIEKYLDTKQIVVITGMRRVGKTTLLKYYFSQNTSTNKVYLNFEDILTRKLFGEENYANVVRNLSEEGLSFENKAYVYIDELQYVPNAPSVIKYLYDEYDVKFIVTGSSSYYLKNQFSESLAGRKFVVEVFPLTFREFLEFKNIPKEYAHSFANKVALKSDLRAEKYNDWYDEYLDYGGFPEVALTDDYQLKQDMLRDILTSYFQIDVANLADFSDSAKLRDLLVLLTQRVGQKLDISNVSNALELPRYKVYEYIEFLEATYVISLLTQHSSVDNQISATDKLYFVDTGLLRILADVSEGSVFENGVFACIRNEANITYFQTKSGKEIDFVMNRSIGLEVKSTASQKYISYLTKRAQSAKLDEHYLVSKTPSDLDNVIMAWDI